MELVWRVTTNLDAVNKTILFLEKAADREKILYKIFNHRLNRIKKGEMDKDDKYILEWRNLNESFLSVDFNVVKGIKYCDDDIYATTVFVVFYGGEKEWVTLGKLGIYNVEQAAIVMVALEQIRGDNGIVVDDSCALYAESAYRKYRFLYKKWMSGT